MSKLRSHSELDRPNRSVSPARPEISGHSTGHSVDDRGASATVQLPCAHCGLSTPCSSEAEPEQVFCCAGCQGAYQLIHGWGLEDFYALRDQLQTTAPNQAQSKAARYEQFDEPDFLGPSTPIEYADGTCASEFAVHGLHCGACAWLIENAAANEPGLLSARVRMSDHSLRLVFDPRQTKLSRVARLLDRLGYGLAPLDPNRDNQVQLASRRLLVQIAIAGFLAANAMWIAVALYAGEFSGVEVQHSYFLGLVGTVLGVTAVLGPGRTFFVGALASLRTRTPHMDLPVALGLTVGSIVGTYNAVLGHGHLYFDSLGTLVFLLLIGRWIQFRQQQRAAKAVDLMLRVTPRHANLLTMPSPTNSQFPEAPVGDFAFETATSSGVERLVLVDTLTAGDVIRIAPGESVAADGKVVRGSSSLDRSLLTGESLPVSISIGETVAAGTVNLTSPIDVQVTATGRDSRIGRVMQAVESAALEKTPIVQLADRIGGVFVVAITLIAVVTFVWWLPTSLAQATSNATALLIVACPCALALATPLAIAVGLGRAAKANILIRDGQALQQLARTGTIWLDKTGTITAGRQQISTLYGSLEALRDAAAIELLCKHPVASAIVNEAKLRGLMHGGSSSSQLDAVVPGGVIGLVEGRRVCVGNAVIIAQQHLVISRDLEDRMHALAAHGESPVVIAVDSQVVTLLGLSDPIRPGAAEMIQILEVRGWKLGILSGDHPSIVQRVASSVGLEPQRCFGGLTPEEKLAAIRESRAAGQTVVMVGDGANDAAALAAADVGIAIRGGAEVSLHAAPVFVASGRLDSLSTLFAGSARTQQIIFVNFALSLTYNLVAVGLAVFGWISPLIAAILMPISSASVLAITLAVPSFKPPDVDSHIV